MRTVYVVYNCRVFNKRSNNRKFVRGKFKRFRKSGCPSVGVCRRVCRKQCSDCRKLVSLVFRVEGNAGLRAICVVYNCRVFNRSLVECRTKLDAGRDFRRHIEAIVAKEPLPEGVRIFCISSLRNYGDIRFAKNEGCTVSARYKAKEVAIVITECNTRVQYVEVALTFCINRELEPGFRDMKYYAVFYVSAVVICLCPALEVTVKNDNVAVFQTADIPACEDVLIRANLRDYLLIVNVGNVTLVIRLTIADQYECIRGYRFVSNKPATIVRSVVFFHEEVTVARVVVRPLIGNCIVRFNSVLRYHFKVDRKSKFTVVYLRSVEFVAVCIVNRFNIVGEIFICRNSRRERLTIRVRNGCNNATVFINVGYARVHSREGILTISINGNLEPGFFNMKHFTSCLRIRTAVIIHYSEITIEDDNIAVLIAASIIEGVRTDMILICSRLCHRNNTLIAERLHAVTDQNKRIGGSGLQSRIPTIAAKNRVCCQAKVYVAVVVVSCVVITIATFNAILCYHVILCNEVDLTYGSSREIKEFAIKRPTSKFIRKFAIFSHRRIGCRSGNKRTNRQRTRIANNRTVCILEGYVGVNKFCFAIGIRRIRTIRIIYSETNVVEGNCTLSISTIERTVKYENIAVLQAVCTNKLRTRQAATVEVVTLAISTAANFYKRKFSRSIGDNAVAKNTNRVGLTFILRRPAVASRIVFVHIEVETVVKNVRIFHYVGCNNVLIFASFNVAVIFHGLISAFFLTTRKEFRAAIHAGHGRLFKTSNDVGITFGKTVEVTFKDNDIAVLYLLFALEISREGQECRLNIELTVTVNLNAVCANGTYNVGFAVSNKLNVFSTLSCVVNRTRSGNNTFARNSTISHPSRTISPRLVTRLKGCFLNHYGSGFYNFNVRDHKLAVQVASLKDKAGEQFVYVVEVYFRIVRRSLCPRARRIQSNRNRMPFTVRYDSRREDGIRAVGCKHLNNVITARQIPYAFFHRVGKLIAEAEAIHSYGSEGIAAVNLNGGIRAFRYKTDFGILIFRLRTIAGKVPNVFIIYMIEPIIRHSLNLRFFKSQGAFGRIFKLNFVVSFFYLDVCNSKFTFKAACFYDHTGEKLVYVVKVHFRIICSRIRPGASRRQIEGKGMPFAVSNKVRSEDGIRTVGCEYLNDILRFRAGLLHVLNRLRLRIRKLIIKAEAVYGDGSEGIAAVNLNGGIRAFRYETHLGVRRSRTITVEIEGILATVVVVAPFRHILNLCSFQLNGSCRSCFKLRFAFTDINIRNHKFALQTAHLEDEAGEKLVRFVKRSVVGINLTLIPRANGVQIKIEGMPFAIGNNFRRENGIRAVGCNGLNDVVHVFVRYGFFILVNNLVRKRETINRHGVEPVQTRFRIFGAGIRTRRYETDFRVTRSRTIAAKIPYVLTVYVVVAPVSNVLDFVVLKRQLTCGRCVKLRFFRIRQRQCCVSR